MSILKIPLFCRFFKAYFPADCNCVDSVDTIFLSETLFAQTLNGTYANIHMELRVGPDGNAVIIDGRERSVRSQDFVPQNDPQGRPAAGWIIRGNGDVEFNNGTFRGHLDGATGTFSGTLVAAGGTFNGKLTAAAGVRSS